MLFLAEGGLGCLEPIIDRRAQEHVPHPVVEPQVILSFIQSLHEEIGAHADQPRSLAQVSPVAGHLDLVAVEEPVEEGNSQVKEDGAKCVPDVPWVPLLGENGDEQGGVNEGSREAVAQHSQHEDAHARNDEDVVQPVPLQLSQIDVTAQHLAQVVHETGEAAHEGDHSLELVALLPQEVEDDGDAGAVAEEDQDGHQDSFRGREVGVVHGTESL